MWGWLDGIVSGIGDIAESIIQIPIDIIEGILNGIKAIFIPDTESIKENFNATLRDIQDIINLPVDSVKDAFDSVGEQPVQDVVADYNLAGVGTLKLKFFDTEFFRQGVQYFRPLLRGFVVLALFFYNYRQLLTFLGQDPGVYGIAKDRADYHLYRRKEDTE